MQAEGFYLVTGGTSNHLILADVHKSFGVDGKIAEEALDKIGDSLPDVILCDLAISSGR